MLLFYHVVQKSCICHLCLYGKMFFFLNIHKSKNIQLTVTKADMVKWNDLFINVRKTFCENWFRGKLTVKG